MISCNGSSKTGTHALLKTVYLFGGMGFTATHNHIPFDTEQVLGKHIHIRRNPRNVLISWIRFTKQKLREDVIIKNMPYIIDEMKGYLGWLTDDKVLNVSFEDLLTDENELNRISDFIGLPLTDNHFKKLWGNTPTFTNNLSDWQWYWQSELVQKAWVANDGHILETLMGYSPNDKPKVRGV